MIITTVANRLVIQHGGHLRVYSAGEGEGCSFTIELPLSDKTINTDDSISNIPKNADEDCDENNETSFEDTHSVINTPEKIHDTSFTSSVTKSITPSDDTIITCMHHIRRALIVDDAVMNRKMLRRMLEGKVGLIEEAQDGHVAVEMVRESLESIHQSLDYDMILMDFIMPVMNGPEATRRIRQLGYKGMIVGVTGNTMQFDIDTFKSNGVDYVLPKPLNMSALESLLKRNSI
jgi:CheY-like chemotaxis protein